MAQKREIFGWAMYDFANSAFATSIMGVVFQVYFTQEVAKNADLWGMKIPAISLWGYTVSAAMLVVLLTAPALGAIADFSGQKKKFLLVYWLLGCVFTGLLFLVTPGRYLLGMGLFFIALVGFAGGNAFYNAFLPELADEKHLGRVSGLGQGLGYVGGGLCLMLNLVMIQKPAWFGLSGGNHLAVRTSFVVVAGWFMLFALPTFLLVRERASEVALFPAGKGYLAAGYGRVFDTIRQVRRYPELARFLVAFFLFMEGVETVIVMAAALGAEVLQMPSEELIKVYLLVQAVAVVGAIGFGYLADRWGNRNSIAVTLVIWCGLIVYAYFIRTPGEYWLMGVGVGVVVGGTQACSRSMVALMTPREHHAEVFGFFAMAGKAASVVGPFVMAVMTQWLNPRAGILSLSAFIILGLLVTLKVNESKGYRESQPTPAEQTGNS